MVTTEIWIYYMYTFMTNASRCSTCKTVLLQPGNGSCVSKWRSWTRNAWMPRRWLLVKSWAKTIAWLHDLPTAMNQFLSIFTWNQSCIQSIFFYTLSASYQKKHSRHSVNNTHHCGQKQYSSAHYFYMFLLMNSYLSKLWYYFSREIFIN